MSMVSSTTRTTTSTPTITTTRTIASTSARPISSTSITSVKPTSSSIKPSSTSRTTSAITTISAQSPTKPAGSSSMTTSLPSSSPSTSALGSTQSFIQATLNSHNIARAQYGASPLTWNSNLYPGTQQWANACVFQHSGGNYGENLSAAAPQSITVQQGVDLWMTEASMYNYSNPTFSSSTGHFTQVVWKSTTSVACAIASCNFLGNGTGYLVCRYDPPGNYLGQFA
ncbi:CAP domain-containing protein [Lentinula detonsa]|uniref:CAP domain-containing protein n=1 Tax=Lentinula detonsa TaxID=2804962 RepID=A0A9W8P643_9AGAR|nr:CAP domain-containing protein [Lentinula detonsa]